MNDTTTTPMMNAWRRDTYGPAAGTTLQATPVPVPGRGEVVLQVGHQQGATSDSPLHILHFSVRDTGIGIPAELQSTLFEDFVQVDTPLQKRLRGTGLGLSLCKRFAELLGGHVGVDSVVGEGSDFYVVLPYKLAEEAPRAEL